MYAYKTNSPDYLDYLASMMTREEILADPDKCFLLENEYIKDNMEIALRWDAAKNGSYAQKYEFVEYLMCNGTELDADTILHYRKKCDTDPVYKQIAYGYLNDGETIKQIRKEKYGKESDDCFSNPCFYLGRFSAVMGSIGDTKATYSPFNMIADWMNSTPQEEKIKSIYSKQLEQGLISEQEFESIVQEASQMDSQDRGEDIIAPSGGAIPQGQDAAAKHPACGFGRPCFEQGVIPSVVKGWKMLMGAILEGDAQFAQELQSKRNCLQNAMRTGDWMSPKISEMLDLTSKANVKRHLGDCSRLWSQVRRFRLFGSENAYAPVPAENLVDDTNIDGTPQQPLAQPRPEAYQSNPTLPQQVNEGFFLEGEEGDIENYSSLFPEDDYEEAQNVSDFINSGGQVGGQVQ